MSTRAGEIRLGAFLYPTGHHVAAWRHKDAQADAGQNFEHFAELARIAEAARFDMVFMADSNCIGSPDPQSLHRLSTRYLAQFEPVTLLSALAARTSRIGLVGTATTTYFEPFDVARKFASLDLISGGRVGWNVVTSAEPIEAGNFGRDAHMEFGRRYDRAEEFVDVVKGLWNSWEDDAFLRDKESGIYFDREKLHTLDHRGRYFNVRGPLNVARSPQGHPVIVQAGSSEPGRELAARTGELIFTAQEKREDAAAFYRDVKGRMAKHGRAPGEMAIMPGVFVVVGRTMEEAEEKHQYLQSLIHPELMVQQLSLLLGNDMSGYDLDGPVPTDLPETNASRSRRVFLMEMVRRDGLTLRQLYLNLATARGHWVLKGTPDHIADQLESWYQAEAADGFNIMCPYFPGGLRDFAEMVIPELQRRGRFRRAYAGRTLREHLGFAHPAPRRAPEPALAGA